jgi:hypothetical protein
MQVPATEDSGLALMRGTRAHCLGRPRLEFTASERARLEFTASQARDSKYSVKLLFSKNETTRPKRTELPQSPFAVLVRCRIRHK